MELLYLALFTVQILSGCDALSCYECQNNDPIFEDYDADCGSSDFHGNPVECDNCKSCWIGIYDTVSVIRGGSNLGNGGVCSISEGYTECHCSYGNNCNYDLCEWCPGVPTETSPQPTTSTTMGPTTSLKPITTTATHPDSTLPPAEGIRCYNCFNCPTVDGSTTIIQKPGHTACTAAIFLTNSMVIRGSTEDTHPDGECIDEGDAFTCFCSTDLCNDDSFTKELKMNELN